jgi:small-conductance mechanosensitive channel
MAINNSVANITSQSLLTSNQTINNIVIAIIIVLLGLLIGKVLGKVIERLLKEFRIDKTVKEKTGFNSSLQKIISNIVSYAIYFVFLIIALNQVGITSLLLNVLSIVVILILAISTILSIKDSVPNMIAHKRIKETMKKGDKITLGNSVEGKIDEITLFETKLTTKSGDEIYIPNSLFLKETHVKKAKK